jgi:zinc transport system ATP-binding protein
MAEATVNAAGRAGAAAPGRQEPGMLVAAHDLVVGYDRPVLGPVSFGVAAGEVVGIWGPNGVGKSTLLKGVAGTARIHAGRLDRSAELSLAYQGQQPVRLAEMPFRGREYLAYLDAQHAEPPARLAGWLDRRVDRLSGGQFQLLTVWACLASGADLVLLDEPSNNLDPQSMELLTDLLRTPEGHGAVLLVSHEWAFLEAACDRRLEVSPWIP